MIFRNYDLTNLKCPSYSGVLGVEKSVYLISSKNCPE
jgi:hypothetical protein